MKKHSLLLKMNIVLLICCAGIFQAQQAILAAGNTTNSAGGSVSYSVGQIAYVAQEAATGKVNAGVQQPYEIFPLATYEGAAANSLTVYPNPVKDFLIVDFKAKKTENSRYQIFDASGKLVLQGDLKNIKNEVNTSALSSGLYMLTVSGGGKLLKTFKIIKNN